MAFLQVSETPSPVQTCVLILIFTVLLQSFCVSVTYVYFTNELKQIKEKYSRSSIACLLTEDDNFWDPNDEKSKSNPCWEVKWQLEQYIKKVLLRTCKDCFTTHQENVRPMAEAVAEDVEVALVAKVGGGFGGRGGFRGGRGGGDHKPQGKKTKFE